MKEGKLYIQHIGPHTFEIKARFGDFILKMETSDPQVVTDCIRSVNHGSKNSKYWTDELPIIIKGL